MLGALRRSKREEVSRSTTSCQPMSGVVQWRFKFEQRRCHFRPAQNATPPLFPIQSLEAMRADSISHCIRCQFFDRPLVECQSDCRQRVSIARCESRRADILRGPTISASISPDNNGDFARCCPRLRWPQWASCSHAVARNANFVVLCPTWMPAFPAMRWPRSLNTVILFGPEVDLG